MAVGSGVMLCVGSASLSTSKAMVLDQCDGGRMVFARSTSGPEHIYPRIASTEPHSVSDNERSRSASMGRHCGGGCERSQWAKLHMSSCMQCSAVQIPFPTRLMHSTYQDGRRSTCLVIAGER